MRWVGGRGSINQVTNGRGFACCVVSRQHGVDFRGVLSLACRLEGSE